KGNLGHYGSLQRYNLLTKGAAYVEAGVKQYQEELDKREKRTLERLALKHNMVLVENQQT
ncbi:MAG TPA: hypothetical protein VFN95_02760, partial [Flavitalea sp.]|nr:hypothetical protein [Flavitalea sp.]